MGSRIELQEKFEEILGSRNVYYQPPENLRIDYPAILFWLSKIQPVYADDLKYLKKRSYDVTLIDSDPESEFIEKILDLKYSSFDRSYKSDNLNHFTFTLFY